LAFGELGEFIEAEQGDFAPLPAVGVGFEFESGELDEGAGLEPPFKGLLAGLGAEAGINLTAAVP